MGGMSGLMANLDSSKIELNSSEDDFFLEDNQNKEIVDSFKEEEEIKIAGFKLEDLDQYIADAEEELNFENLKEDANV